MEARSCADPAAGCVLHAHMAGMRMSDVASDADSICPEHQGIWTSAEVMRIVPG